MADTSAPERPRQKKALICSALPYVNAEPHLGNIIGSTLSADVFSRYCKARGRETIYICGTDEYGTATETKALKEGLTPRELCDKYYEIHSEVYKWFNINFSHFGRTSTPQQTEIAQDIFLKLHKNGYLEERETVQPYCEKHDSFLADRFVEGTCSICGDPGARGDQCDKCGSLLDPLEPDPDTKLAADPEEGEPPGDTRATGFLINPRCSIDGATPVRRNTKHVFLRLDALKDKHLPWFQKASVEGKWSTNSVQITQSWIDKGLKPRAITRDLKWGTPIPLEGYETKVMYVWFDACIGYISITACFTENWRDWWYSDDVELYHFLGKDNVPFHSCVFPSSQLGTLDPWTTAHHISATEYLNYEGGKFSKSRSIGVFGRSAKNTGIPADVWRYYLLSRRPESGDSEFQWSEFISANNGDLLKNLGNFVNRVIKFVGAKYDSVVPDYTSYDDSDGYFKQHNKGLNELLAQYIEYFDNVKLRGALATTLQISSLGNKLLQDNKLDNRLFSEEPSKCAAVIGTALNHIHLLASIIEPFMPATALSIFQQLGTVDQNAETLSTPPPHIPDQASTSAVEPGRTIGKAGYLFTQIKPEREKEWREAFGGDEARKQREAEAAKRAEKKAKKDADKAARAAKKLAAAEGGAVASSTSTKPAADAPTSEIPAAASTPGDLAADSTDAGAAEAETATSKISAGTIAGEPASEAASREPTVDESANKPLQTKDTSEDTVDKAIDKPTAETANDSKPEPEPTESKPTSDTTSSKPTTEPVTTSKPSTGITDTISKPPTSSTTSRLPIGTTPRKPSGSGVLSAVAKIEEALSKSKTGGGK